MAPRLSPPMKTADFLLVLMGLCMAGFNNFCTQEAKTLFWGNRLGIAK